MVTGYEQLIDAMPSHTKVQHVAAVAVEAGVIVTSNLDLHRARREGAALGSEGQEALRQR